TFGMSSAEALRMAAVAGGAAAGAGGLGTVALHLLRRRSIATQAIVVALTALGAVAAGALAASRAMFISDHDLHVLWVVLIVAVTVAIVAALVLGQRVVAARRALGETARRIGEGLSPAAADPSETAEFRALAAELQEMSRRLEEARFRERALEASRRELVAWISHDLRTPLAGIRAMSEALEDGVVSDAETVAEYHARLRREADHLAGLVDDLFELSRIQAGALRLEMERVSLSDLVSDAIAAADPVAAAKRVRVSGRTDSAPELSLSASDFSRVLRNLLENAIRHTPADGTVWVEAGVADGRAYVSVADGCGGIPPPDLDRVFDLAFRGEAARTPGDGGAGLGLSIARGIVDAHEGEIEVENAGDGCRFTVRLPLDGEGAAVRAAGPRLLGPAPPDQT
ncbi:MAG: HAMP domain-containing sensor histidine kinase, partial [Actinomycetota bacterium]